MLRDVVVYLFCVPACVVPAAMAAAAWELIASEPAEFKLRSTGRAKPSALNKAAIERGHLQERPE
jgi:hypothetical protein